MGRILSTIVIFTCLYVPVALPQKENILKRQYKSFMDDARLVARCLKKTSKCSADERAQAPYAAARVIGTGVAIVGTLLFGGYIVHKFHPWRVPSMTAVEMASLTPAITQYAAEVSHYSGVDKIQVVKEGNTYGVYIPLPFSAPPYDGGTIIDALHAKYPFIKFLWIGSNPKLVLRFEPEKPLESKKLDQAPKDTKSSPSESAHVKQVEIVQPKEVGVIDFTKSIVNIPGVDVRMGSYNMIYLTMPMGQDFDNPQVLINTVHKNYPHITELRLQEFRRQWNERIFKSQ